MPINFYFFVNIKNATCGCFVAKTKNKNPYEMGAMESYFRYYFRFNQKGAAIKVNGEIVAMSFGEKLCEDTALIQVELADENYRGSYQAINRFFCENAWKDLKYVSDEVAWIEIAYNLNENNQRIQKIDIDKYYGKLDKGIYRVVKTIYDNGNIDLYSDAFEIK